MPKYRNPIHDGTPEQRGIVVTDPATGLPYVKPKPPAPVVETVPPKEVAPPAPQAKKEPAPTPKKSAVKKKGGKRKRFGSVLKKS